MEYTVGSLADLISGTRTPNKPKLIKQNIKVKKQTSTEKSNADKNKTENKLNKKLLKRKCKDTDTELSPKKFKKTKKKGEVNKKPLDEQRLSKNGQNAERRVNNKLKPQKQPADPEILARTIYVGNVPLKASKKQIENLFKKYGTIESVWCRGIPVADPNTPKKIAAIKKEYHPNRNNAYWFIRYAERESAKHAQVENGTLFEDHHLRVEVCEKSIHDETKAIFVGNLSFNAEEEELWKLFEPCGEISHVRIVRDSLTGMGKGFAYINFKDADSVQLALEMENVKLRDREIRISVSNWNQAKKSKNKRDLGRLAKKYKQKNKANKGLLEKKRKIKKIAPIAK